MRKKFNIETPDHPMVASFLDPHFKSLTFLLEGARLEAQPHVVHVSLVQQQVSLQHPPSQSRSEQERTEGDPCSPPTAKKPCTSALDIIGDKFAEKASTSAEQTAESELKMRCFDVCQQYHQVATPTHSIGGSTTSTCTPDYQI